MKNRMKRLVCIVMMAVMLFGCVYADGEIEEKASETVAVPEVVSEAISTPAPEISGQRNADAESVSESIAGETEDAESAAKPDEPVEYNVENTGSSPENTEEPDVNSKEESTNEGEAADEPQAEVGENETGRSEADPDMQTGEEPDVSEENAENENRPESAIEYSYQVEIYVVDPKASYQPGDIIRMETRIIGECPDPSYRWQVQTARDEEWVDIEGADEWFYEFPVEVEKTDWLYRVVVTANYPDVPSLKTPAEENAQEPDV